MGYNEKGVRLARYAEALKLNPNGRKKLRCPACGSLSFVPYIFDEVGLLTDTAEEQAEKARRRGTAIDIQICGRCDHAEGCGYHLPPSEYFARYPERRPRSNISREERKEIARKEAERREAEKRRLQFLELLEEMSDTQKAAPMQTQNTEAKAENKPKAAPCVIPWEYVQRSQEKAEQTALFRFLASRFNVDIVRRAFDLYHIGGDKYGRTIFWQINEANEVKAGKIMKYAENGHRAKLPDGSPEPGAMNWAHAVLKKAGLLPEAWELSQCLFGLHLLITQNTAAKPKSVCLVESEKTALIASIVMPQNIWLATGGKYNLTPEKLAPLRAYTQKAGPITVFPDLGSRDLWAEKLEASRLVLPFVVSDFVEDEATEKARGKGMDLGDWILGEF